MSGNAIAPHIIYLGWLQPQSQPPLRRRRRQVGSSSWLAELTDSLGNVDAFKGVLQDFRQRVHVLWLLLFLRGLQRKSTEGVRTRLVLDLEAPSSSAQRWIRAAAMRGVGRSSRKRPTNGL
ncbi:uncharacterized protein LOC119376323 [Rhipicephalus sanguineus]|nr:uncharacterized protein LOC119376323 [Rhipicephalus sanguineus]